MKDNNSSHVWASKQPWYEEVVQKFKLRVVRRVHSRDLVEEQLIKKQYKNITKWSQDNLSSYCWSKKQPWYREIKKIYFSKKSNVINVDFSTKTKKAA